MDQLHAKVYVIDGEIAITGSANLTESGMYRNLEHIDMKLNPKLISEISEKFDETWAGGKVLKDVDSKTP